MSAKEVGELSFIVSHMIELVSSLLTSFIKNVHIHFSKATKMEVEAQSESRQVSSAREFQFKCPCSKNKSYLGVFEIIPKDADVSAEMLKVQRKFFLGQGINTTDPVAAAELFLHRDHEELADLKYQYCPGKLGVYMVPPMFYGEVPQAVHLSEFKVAKYLAGVRGDIAERSMFFQLEKYYKSTGDDVLIIHSHKFLNKEGNNEKDFIVLNLTKGNF